MSDHNSFEDDPIINDEATPAVEAGVKDAPKKKKVQFPDLVDKPYWGKKDPESQHWYTDADGEQLFVVGRFTYPGSKREDFVTAFFNGEEWVKKVPTTWEKSRPLFNMIGLWNEEQSWQSMDVVVVQDEWKAFRLEEFFRKFEMSYIATTWNGGAKGIRKTLWDQGLRHRNVILWPNSDDFSANLFETVKGCVSPIVETLREVEPNGSAGFGVIDVLKNIENEENGWTISSLRDLLHSAMDVPLVTPATEINDQGIGHLETTIPLGFIEKLKEDYGQVGKDGRKVLGNSYIAAMNIVNEDPAFKNCIKYDEAIADIIWDKSRYPTIDDLKNAILRRIAQYGVNLPRGVRDDIVQTMSNDPERKINTIRTMMDELCIKHNDASESDLDELLKHIEIEGVDGVDAIKNGLPSKSMYRKAFAHFFTKATMRLYTAYSPNPITNDAVLVFVGGQGVGKTRLCKYMAMSDAKYVDLGNKSATFGSPDWVRHVMGMLVAELGEMHVMRKSEVETIKSGISEVYDSLTPKYKEGVKRVPRTVSFVGTSNEVEFLRDLSGNRRFFPIMVKRVNHEYLFSHPEIIERVWAYYYSNIRSVMQEWDSGGKLLPYANQPPSWMIRPEDGMVNYFRIVCEESTDMGMSGELIRNAIMEIEAENSRKPRVDISLLSLAAKVYGEGDVTSARDDFKKKSRWYLERFGYTIGRGEVDGQRVRVYTISTSDERFQARIAGQVKQSTEW